MADLSSLIAGTQAALGPLITKPKLTEKHLSKPPFRYLHDIVSGVIASTGFAADLFPAEYENAKAMDKPAKVQYLEMIINHVNSARGEEVDVRPSKVVAGLEPENTNMFLQALAAAAVAHQSGGGGDAGGKEDDGGKAADDGAAAAREAEAAELARQQAETQAEAEAEERAAADRQRQREEEERQRQQAERERAAAAAAAAEAKAAEGGGNDVLSQVDGSPDTTRAILEPIFDKPKLTDKLLGKPPFRFLHDVVMAVQRATGFTEGLYAEDMLVGKAIKDKGVKLEFLQQTIDCVGIKLGAHCRARPSKIVAGLEPELTNEFLQMLGLAAKAPGSDDVVARVLSGEKQPAEGADAGGGGKEADDDGDRVRAQAAARAAEEDRERQAAREREERAAAEERERREADAARAAAAGGDDGGKEGEGAAGDFGAAAGAAGFGGAGPVAAGPGVGGPAASGGAASSGQGGPVVRRMARPQTARRRPPKIKENVTESAGPKAAEAVAVGVMRDGEESDSESDAEAADLEQKRAELGAAASADAAAVGKHTRDILDNEAKADAAKGADDGGGSSSTTASSASGIKMGRIKKTGDKSAFSQLDVEKLRSAIQRLCQSTNPLGKCMDYVNEDMDVMKSELQQWKTEAKRRSTALEEERATTEEVLQPLTKQLAEADQLIADQMSKINAVKANIAKNDVRIQELLRMVVSN